jgi:3-isopropylmalate dehydrogenase
MMVDSLGQMEMGKAIESAVMQTTPRLKSLSAGKMGYSTREVGDLVVDELRRDA